jgi:hypothetical protein
VQIAFEPVLRNIGRVARSIEANAELAGRIHILKNAVGSQRIDSGELSGARRTAPTPLTRARLSRAPALRARTRALARACACAHCVHAPASRALAPHARPLTANFARGSPPVTMKFAPANSGGSRIDPFEAGPNAETVSQVVLDDLFFAPDGASGTWEPMPCHLRNPFTGEALRPSDVGFIKIDAEGFDGRVLHGLRRSLDAGAASGGLMLELSPKSEACDPLALVEHLEGLGFAYLHHSGGVGGSRWMRPKRLRRQIFASLSSQPCNVAGHIEHVLEGLWLRGEMRALAEKAHPVPEDL